MGKMIALLVLVGACVAGYLTRPDEAAQRAAADAVLRDPQNISEGMQGLGATLAGDRMFFDYYVMTKYTVKLDGKPIVECLGAFTKTKCTRNKPSA